MSVVWVHTENHDVFDVIEHTRHVMAAASETWPDSQPQAPDDQDDLIGKLAGNDSYLQENVQVLHDDWELDPWRIVEVRLPVVGNLLGLGQRAVRRLTGWYTLPQAQQISRFHAASVRTIDSILARTLDLSARLQALERVHSAQRLQLLEEQLRDVRRDYQALLRRVAELEAQLAAHPDHEQEP